MPSHLDTPALQALQSLGLPHEVVRTARAGSVEEAAILRGVTVAALIKTIVVRRAQNDYLFVLVPGDREIDWGKLRAHLGVRRLSLPDAEDALAATGYERGAITPFGTTHPWPVIADASIQPAAEISLGGGAHGTSVKIQAGIVFEAVGAERADVTKTSA